MKIRDGFVSNSSSTNYTIAVKPPKTDVEKVMLEAIEILAKNHKNTFERCSAEEYKNKLEFELEEKTKDIKCAVERLEYLKEISEREDILNLLKIIKESTDAKESISWLRTAIESEYKWTIERDIEWINRDVRKSKEQIEYINSMLESMKTLEGASEILIFDKDSWDDHRIKTAIDTFDKHSNILRIVKLEVT